MKVKDVMSKNVVFVNPDDPVSAAFTKINKNNVNQLPVMDGKTYLGMITLKDVAVKDINPSEAKCGHFVAKTPSIRSNDDVEGAISLLLTSGFRAIPVIDDFLVGIISETDVLKIISKNYGNIQLSKIATECEYVSKSDVIGKVKRIMIDKNVSRVPVLDKNNVIGIVGLADMTRLLEGKGPMPVRGRGKEPGTKEKLNLNDSEVGNFMHKPFISKGDVLLKNVIDSLAKNGEVILIENGVSIVTPKDVLELAIGNRVEDLHIDIIGLNDESVQFKSKLDKTVSEFTNKMKKTVDRAQYLFVHVEKSNKGGKNDHRFLYLIRARFGTPMGMFVAKAQGWDPMIAIQEVMDNLEREIFKKYGKTRDTWKKRRVLTKRRN